MKKTSSDSSGSNTMQSHCNVCGHETKHNILNRVDSSRSVGEYDEAVDFGTHWKVLQCCGCDEVTLTRQDWCSEEEEIDRFGYRLPPPITYFPPRVSRRMPDWAGRRDVPDEYSGLLDEMYIALHADSRRLAMMGARSLIDAVILRNVGDQGTFPEGLKQLVEQELIGGKTRDVLQAAVEMGSAAIHRGHNPDEGSLNTVIDIVENLIHNELLLSKKEVLEAKTPKRPPRVKKPKGKTT